MASVLKIETVRLWKNPEIKSDIVRYIPSQESAAKPALLIIPGGAYNDIADDHEGRQVADKFAALGLNPFILHYRVQEECSPENTFGDALRAIKLIRANAQDWKIIPDNIAVVGFSAGGHLAGAAATFYKEIDANDGDEADMVSGRPDAVILSYPVISMEKPYTESLTHNNLLRSKPGQEAVYSLNKRVTADTPPAFLWHTATDQCVPMQNSLLFFEAMRNNAPDKPCALHIFPEGPHGIGLAPEQPDASRWPDLAAEFLKLRCNFKL